MANIFGDITLPEYDITGAPDLEQLTYEHLYTYDGQLIDPDDEGYEISQEALTERERQLGLITSFEDSIEKRNVHTIREQAKQNLKDQMTALDKLIGQSHVEQSKLSKIGGKQGVRTGEQDEQHELLMTGVENQGDLIESNAKSIKLQAAASAEQEYDKYDSGLYQWYGTWLAQDPATIEKVPDPEPEGGSIGWDILGSMAAITIANPGAWAAAASWVGSAIVTAGTWLMAFSDKSVKKNLVRVDDYHGLPVYRFNYIWDDDSDRPYEGFLAQDVEKVLPEAVHEIEGIKAVDYKMVTDFYSQGGLNG